MALHWQEIARSKQEERDARIKPEWRLQNPPPSSQLNVLEVPRTCGLLDALELEITESTATVIVETVAQRKWTSVQVATAFIKRAAIAQQLVNCLTEFFPDEALETARALDSYLEQHGRIMGPLHGLPISIKDNFKIKGHASSVGFVGWANEKMEADSELIKILRAAGAILYAKTNISEAMMIAESYNNVWGRTVNPANRSLTCGGSSGGEGALIALRGSPLGVGTDIGGSVRIPAACNGIFGLKVSLGRFPTYGARSGMAGQEAVPSTNGPLSWSLDAIQLFAKTVVDAQPWLIDPKMLPIPWRTIELPDRITFAYVEDDLYCRPAPPIRRHLRAFVEKLQRAGHEVIPWDVGNEFEQSVKLLPRLFTSDGAQTMHSNLATSDEPWPKGLLPYEKAYSDPERDLRTSELWKLHLQRTDLVAFVYAKWNATASKTSTGRPVDALITPAMTLPPCRHDKFGTVDYTCIWNICDQPGLVFPVGKVDKAIDAREEHYKPRNPEAEHVYTEYDPEVYHDAPITLQLVTRRLEEEKAVAILKRILQ